LKFEKDATLSFELEVQAMQHYQYAVESHVDDESYIHGPFNVLVIRVLRRCWVHGGEALVTIVYLEDSGACIHGIVGNMAEKVLD